MHVSETLFMTEVIFLYASQKNVKVYENSSSKCILRNTLDKVGTLSFEMLS